jgi:hypothetical protein
MNEVVKIFYFKFLIGGENMNIIDKANPTREEFLKLIEKFPNWMDLLDLRTIDMVKLWLLGKNYTEIGKIYNVTCERIRQKIWSSNKQNGAYYRIQKSKDKCQIQKIKLDKRQIVLTNIVIILENLKYCKRTKTGKIRKKRKEEIYFRKIHIPRKIN